MHLGVVHRRGPSAQVAWPEVCATGSGRVSCMTFLPAEKDRPRRGPMWPMQRWADKNPTQGLLFIGVVIAFSWR